MESFEELGGKAEFIKWGRKEENRKFYYELVFKLMPKDINLESESLNNLAEALKNVHERRAIGRNRETLIEVEARP